MGWGAGVTVGRREVGEGEGERERSVVKWGEVGRGRSKGVEKRGV